MNPKLAAGIEKAQKSIAKTMGTDRMYNAMDQHKHVCGFKIPNLAYQIYILTDHIPFGIHGESAPPHVGKSMIGIEKGIWAIQDGCFSHITDTEHKHSVDMVTSLLRRKISDRDQWALFKQTKAMSLEESQQINTQLLKTAIEDKTLPKSDRYGIYSLTDSLLGASGQDSIDAILKEGYAKGRGYKEETLAIKNYCEAFDTSGSFFAWNTVQHAKKSLDPNARGISAWNVIGGDHPRFVSMTHTLMQRADQWESVENGAKVNGHNIRMTLLKNGVGGEDRRVLYAGLRWTMKETEDEGTVQETWFDWNWSLGWLLAQQTLENPKVPAKTKERLKEILYFTVKNQNNVVCPRYSESAITYSELGKCIEEDQEVKDGIKRLFGVKSILNYRDIDLPDDTATSGKKKGGRPKKIVEEKAETEPKAKAEAPVVPAEVEEVPNPLEALEEVFSDD